MGSSHSSARNPPAPLQLSRVPRAPARTLQPPNPPDPVRYPPANLPTAQPAPSCVPAQCPAPLPGLCRMPAVRLAERCPHGCPAGLAALPGGGRGRQSREEAKAGGCTLRCAQDAFGGELVSRGGSSSPRKELTRLQRAHPGGSQGMLRFHSCRTRGPRNRRRSDGVIFSPVNVNPGSVNASAAPRPDPPPPQSRLAPTRSIPGVLWGWGGVSGGLVPPALLPGWMWKRAGWWERRKGFPSWRGGGGGCNCTVQIEPVRRPSDSTSRGTFTVNNKEQLGEEGINKDRRGTYSLIDGFIFPRRLQPQPPRCHRGQREPPPRGAGRGNQAGKGRKGNAGRGNQAGNM